MRTMLSILFLEILQGAVLRGFVRDVLAARQQLHVSGYGIQWRTDFVGQAGRHLARHGEALSARESFLRVSKSSSLMRRNSSIRSLPQACCGFLNLESPEFGIEILDAAQHPVQVGRQQPNLVRAVQVGPQVQLPLLRPLHNLNHLSPAP